MALFFCFFEKKERMTFDNESHPVYKEELLICLVIFL